MNDCCLISCMILFLVALQSCTTFDTKVKESPENNKRGEAEGDLLKELDGEKRLLDDKDVDEEYLESEKLSRPVEFGMSLERVQDIFPAPDKFEYRPFVNGKVTMLSRDASGGRYNFFFYEGKVYKVVFMKKWGSFSLRFAKDDINEFIDVFLEGYGRPDESKSDNVHQKMVWFLKESEVTIEVFNLMSHSGLERVLTLVYAERSKSALAKSSEGFELYRTKERGILDQ